MSDLEGEAGKGRLIRERGNKERRRRAEYKVTARIPE